MSAPLIPVDRVHLTYAPSVATQVVNQYYGILLGAASDLHDIQSKGFFEPTSADTEVLDGSGEPLTLTGSASSTPVEITPADYPRYRANSEIKTDTVKPYFKSTSYLGMLNTSVEDENIYIVPTGDMSFKFMKKITAPVVFAGEAVIGTSGTKSTVDLSKLEAQVSGVKKHIMPGSVKIVLTNGTKFLYLTDTPNTGCAVTTISLAADAAEPIFGNLYAYESSAGDWPIAATIFSNTLKVNYADGTISGLLTFGIVVAGLAIAETVPGTLDQKCFGMETILPGDTTYNFAANISAGDFISYGSTVFTGTPNVADVLPVGWTYAATTDFEASYLIDVMIDHFIGGTPLTGYAPAGISYAPVSSVASDGTMGAGSYSHKILNSVGSKGLDYRVAKETCHIAYELDAYRRLELGDDKHYTIVTSGTDDVKGTLDIQPATIIFETMFRDTTRAYDADPMDYTAITPAINFVNFICGQVYVEYENELHSVNLINKRILFSADGSNNPVNATYIGQYDPRNRLGFAAFKTNEMSGSTVPFYVMPVNFDGEGLSLAYDVLSKYEDILHLGLLNESDNYIGGLDAWLTLECAPERSRFKFGYCSKSLDQVVDKVLAAELAGGTIETDIDGNRYFNCTKAGWNYNTKSVASGDTFQYTDPSDDTVKTLTVASWDSDTLNFEETAPTLKLALTVGSVPMGTIPTNHVTGTVVAYGKVKDTATKLISFASTALVTDPGSTTGAKLTVAVNAGGEVTVSASAGYTLVGNPWITYYRGAITLTEHEVYRSLSALETSNLMYANQTMNNRSLVKVVAGTGVQYEYTDTNSVAQVMTIDRWFNAVYPFALKISTPPHQPLTNITLSGFGFSKVYGLDEFKPEHISKMAEGGLYLMASEEGGEPYCKSDVTTAIKISSELEGVLSKVCPQYQFAKDIHQVSRPYLGRVNVVTDLITILSLKLLAVRDIYIKNEYNLLGTLLASVSVPTITEVPNGVRIDYTISPQDPFRASDHYVLVTDKQ